MMYEFFNFVLITFLGSRESSKISVRSFKYKKFHILVTFDNFLNSFWLSLP